MPGCRRTAALLLGTSLLATLPAVSAAADAPTPQAQACMDEAVRFQHLLATTALPSDEREEIQATLVHAHEEAKGGNISACADAISRADRFVQEAAGKPAASAPGLPTTPAAAAPSLQPPAPKEAAVDPALGRLLQLAGLTEAEGVTVANDGGESIGEVSEVVRTADGSQTLLVVGIGGFLGLGERDVALPVQAFQPGVKQLTLPGYDRASLEALPVHHVAVAPLVTEPSVASPNAGRPSATQPAAVKVAPVPLAPTPLAPAPLTPNPPAIATRPATN